MPAEANGGGSALLDAGINYLLVTGSRYHVSSPNHVDAALVAVHAAVSTIKITPCCESSASSPFGGSHVPLARTMMRLIRPGRSTNFPKPSPVQDDHLVATHSLTLHPGDQVRTSARGPQIRRTADPGELQL